VARSFLQLEKKECLALHHSEGQPLTAGYRIGKDTTKLGRKKEKPFDQEKINTKLSKLGQKKRVQKSRNVIKPC